MSLSKSKARLLIFIVTYNAEKTIAAVLSRIPENIFKDPRYDTEILIIDDGSRDQTFSLGLDIQGSFKNCPIIILKNPVNQGYGGNQKIGYRYALDHNFDIVVLLHGDGQYAPEELPKLVEPFFTSEDRPAAVFGSRMMNGFSALDGGMPKYKFIGNKILTFIQNRLTGMSLSEWHSGYRLYSADFLRAVPFELNSNGFEFDTDIIVQIIASGKKVVELPIPTFYGDEISHVNVIPYGLRIMWTCLLFRIQKLSLLYDPKFDLQSENNQYQEKFSYESSHSAALRSVNTEDSCLIVGCGPAEITEPFVKACASAAVMDIFISPEIRSMPLKSWQVNLDDIDLQELTRDMQFSKVLALDVIEHLKSPENFCSQLRACISCENAEIIISTPNVTFLPVRLMMLLGSFNYGKRGILDRTHTRLFTVNSLKRLLQQSGFDILEVKGIPAPFPLALGKSRLASLLLELNIFLCRLMPGLFSFQIFVRARPRPTVSRLLQKAVVYSESEKCRLKAQGSKRP